MFRNRFGGCHGSAGWCAISLLGLALASFSGCGSGGSPTGKVSGKVTAQGQPVTGGSLVLSPIASTAGETKAGKPATGEVKSDGSFELSTYSKGDGAVIGEHRVTYSPPAVAVPEGMKEGDPMPTSPYAGLVPKEAKVTIAKGSNTLNIELVPGPPPGSPVPGAPPKI